MARREVETSEYIEFAKRIIRRAGERVAQADDWDLAELASYDPDIYECAMTNQGNRSSDGQG